MDKFNVEHLDLYYGDFKALKDINLKLPANEITAFIGPSGCGKSTFLKSLNRMNDLVEGEVESLFRIMRELKALGVALVYISHKMDEIKVIADEVTIMRDGQYIGKWDVANMTKEEIIAKMVGRELSNLFPPLENAPSDEVMMKVEDFTSIHPRSFRHCSFELKKGEILGVAGLVGAQRTELMEGIFGLRAKVLIVVRKKQVMVKPKSE